MRKLISIFTLTLFYVTISFGQAAVDIPIIVSDNVGNSQTLNFGLDLTATDGIDELLGEISLPPWSFSYEARMMLPDFGPGVESSWKDYREATIFPFTGSMEHRLMYQVGDGGGTEITIEWDFPPEVTGRLQDIIFGYLIDTVMVGIGSYTVTAPGSFPQLKMTIEYDNVGPSGGPQITFTPPSLDFGDVVVGESATLPATVNNPGTEDLEITAVTPTGPFTTTAVPTTIGAGLSVPFDVTYTATALGNESGSIDFENNTPAVTTSYALSGNGVEIISTITANVNLVNVGTGSTVETDIVVTNNSSAPVTVVPNIIELPNWDIDLTPTIIPAGDDYTFPLFFYAPTTAGTYPGTLEFLVGSSPIITIGLSATVVSVAGLIFIEDTVYNLEEEFYMEEMGLKSFSDNVQALQFRLLTNQNGDDNTILTFQSIEKGLNIASDDTWVLEYNVLRGPITGNGASQDEIIILLYNLEEDNGLVAGNNYEHLLKVNYRVADLPALTDSVKSSFLITEAEASTFLGFPVDITPSRDELVVIAKNRVGSWGDVNGDGCLDILDLIMVVDHIVGRDSLDAEEFARADIAPWVPGNETPDPDGFVNVQDLALIQTIILTGFFPDGVPNWEDGTPVGGCPSGLAKFNGEADAILNLYINNEGITAYLDSKVGIRGAQIEFGNLVDNPENMVINTELGNGYYLKVDDMLRTLMYDRLAEKYIEAGTYQFMADLPFQITSPEDISLDRLILVDTDQRKLMKIEVNLIYSSPTLPYDYILFQNYPNPFNPSTAVRFQVPQTGNVTIKIYDMLGQEVRTLFAGEVTRGTYTTNWDGLNDAGVQMSSGSYIYRMTAGEFVQSKKMILLK